MRTGRKGAGLGAPEPHLGQADEDALALGVHLQRPLGFSLCPLLTQLLLRRELRPFGRQASLLLPTLEHDGLLLLQQGTLGQGHEGKG